MDLEKIFKNLIIIDAVMLVVTLIVAFNESDYIIELQEQLPQGINATGAGIIFNLLIVIAYIVNLFMLYKYISFGKPLYLILFCISILLSLMSGVLVMNAFLYTLAWLGSAISGALLVLLYYSPIKTKFEK